MINVAVGAQPSTAFGGMFGALPATNAKGVHAMFSALFGRKKVGSKNPPLDTVASKRVSIPYWRSWTKDGESRFAFRFSREYEKFGKKYYAKTLEIQDIKDIFYAIEKLTKRLIDERELPLRDRHTLARISVLLERVLFSPEMKSEQQVNGHSEPSIKA